jgi:hypothetical protein
MPFQLVKKNMPEKNTSRFSKVMGNGNTYLDVEVSCHFIEVNKFVILIFLHRSLQFSDTL